jgi:hypothetical protein
MPGILAEDDWSFTYKDKVWPLIDEKQFKHLYKEEKVGAPNVSIRLKISLLIFMAQEQLTWRRTESMYRCRLDWMNATYTGVGKAIVDHTTLFKFYRQLEDDNSAYQLFVDLTDSFVKECDVSTDKQRVDSFFMLGWLAILSRYGLFKETMRAFLQALRKQKPGLYEEIKPKLSRNYLHNDFDLTEKDKEKTRGKVKEMARDLYLVKSSFESHTQIKHYKTFKTLAKVFEQQCVVKTKKESSVSDNDSKTGKEIIEVVTDTDVIEPDVEIREKPTGEKIISSPHNTDAVYTRKRKQTVVGHKGFVTETCDPDNDVQFITDVNLEPATHADAKEILEIETRLEDNNLKPKTLYGDAGFVNGESILESKNKGIDLAGPSSGRSQSFEGFTDDARPLDIADFQVSVDDATRELSVLSCPEGQDSTDQHRSDKTGKILVHFKSDICRCCISSERCPVKIGVHIATLNVDEAQYAGATRHHKYMGDTEYRKECGIRAGAESLVNEIANSHNGRKSRHRNEKGSRLQLIFAVMSCNVKRFIRCRQNYVKNPVNVVI